MGGKFFNRSVFDRVVIFVIIATMLFTLGATPFTPSSALPEIEPLYFDPDLLLRTYLQGLEQQFIDPSDFVWC